MTPAETWVALVHHPVYDKNRRVVATALTNLDLHDIARATRTYGLAGFLVVHPVAAQRELATRIAGHWLSDEGAEQNDFRRQAIERVAIVETLEAAVAHVAARAGRPPVRLATCARPAENALAFATARKIVDGPALIVLGTGWGLTDEILDGCERRLAPIQAGSDYNHLSVRSACAIILDRLYGDREDYAP